MTIEQFKSGLTEDQLWYDIYVSCWTKEYTEKCIAENKKPLEFAHATDVDREDYTVLLCPFFDDRTTTIFGYELYLDHGVQDTKDCADIEIWDVDDQHGTKVENIYINDKDKYIILY